MNSWFFLDCKRQILESCDEDDYFQGLGAFVDAVVDDVDRFERDFPGANLALFSRDLIDGQFAGEEIAQKRDGMLVPAGRFARRHFDEQRGDFRRAVARVRNGLAEGVGRRAKQRIRLGNHIGANCKKVVIPSEVEESVSLAEFFLTDSSTAPRETSL